MAGLGWYPCGRLQPACVGVSVWLVGVVSVWQAEAVLQPATRIEEHRRSEIKLNK